MKLALILALSGLLSLLCISAARGQAAPGAPQSFHDDFASHPAGSDASPVWEPQTVGWEVQDGGYIGDIGSSSWRAVPMGGAVTFSCDVTVLEKLKGDWLTAGIGLEVDDENYWQVNLVVTPELQKRRHTVEMHESLAGHWLAESAPESRLAHQTARTGGFDWQVNKTYRFDIRLSADEVVGRIFDGATEAARFSVKLDGDAKAVRMGRPFLRSNGLRTRFSNATVSVDQIVPDPVTAKLSFPAWTPRAGKPIAKGTGFFRTALISPNGETPAADPSSPPDDSLSRWWLVDPEGKPFFDIGTDHVNYRGSFCEALGYSPYGRNVKAKFANEQAWAASALDRLKAWGFTTLTAGNSPSLRHQGLPHILFASFGSTFARREWISEPIHWTGFPDVFSPRWASSCRFLARKLAREDAGDPWCIGSFLDNELEWYGKKGNLVDEVFLLGPKSSAKAALYDWLMKRYGSQGEINHRLGEHFADKQAFLAAQTIPYASASMAEIREGFMAEIAERYFSVAAGAMREADPRHLVLGCRFAGRTPAAALAAAGKYNDVFTFNAYPRVDFDSAWRADGAGGAVQRVPRELAEMYKVVRRPMIITEWGFPALDSGLPCQHGAGMRVDTQEQKAACYRIFASAMADLPFMVGYHYFMWADEPAPGISSTFPEDSNYGVVNEKDETYQTLTKTAAEVNLNAAARHEHSSFSGELDMRSTGDAIELANNSALPSHGVLRIIAGPQSSVEDVTLLPHGSRRIAVSKAAAWCAELQQWDGTKLQCRGGKPLEPLAVANVSAAAVEALPVVLDGPPVAAALIPRLEPGQSFTLSAPAAAPAEVEQVELKAADVTWRSTRRDGSLFDDIRAGDLPIGRLVFAVHQEIAGQESWTETNKVTSLQLAEQADAWIVEAVVEHAGAQGRGPAHYRAGVRAVVFKKGGLALVKPLWLENTDSRPWRLREAFWFCRPAIGGSTADNEIGGPNVPNYYRPAQFSTNRKLGGCFGALSDASGWTTTFWKDPAGSIHPDTRWVVDQDLTPGQRWSADDVSYVWIFASHNADAWRNVARQKREASGLFSERTHGAR